MRQPLLLALLAIATFFYFQTKPSPKSTVGTPAAPAPAHSTTVSQAPGAPEPQIVLAPAHASYSERWKTGPNAQTEFEPFLPNQQEHWHDNPGYTVVSGRLPRR